MRKIRLLTSRLANIFPHLTPNTKNPKISDGEHHWLAASVNLPYIPKQDRHHTKMTWSTCFNAISSQMFCVRTSFLKSNLASHRCSFGTDGSSSPNSLHTLLAGDDFNGVEDAADWEAILSEASQSRQQRTNYTLLVEPSSMNGRLYHSFLNNEARVKSPIYFSPGGRMHIQTQNPLLLVCRGLP